MPCNKLILSKRQHITVHDNELSKLVFKNYKPFSALSCPFHLFSLFLWIFPLTCPNSILSCFNSFNFHSNSEGVLFLFPCGNWGKKRLNNIPKITELVNGGTRQFGSRAHTKPFPKIYSCTSSIHPPNSSQSDRHKTQKSYHIASKFKIFQWFSIALWIKYQIIVNWLL